MIAVCVTFKIKPGQMDAFMVPMVRQARQSCQLEPGCHRFDVCSEGEQADTVFLYELYESRDAFQQHLESEHFLQFDAAVQDMVAQKAVQIHDLVTVGDAGQ